MSRSHIFMLFQEQECSDLRKERDKKEEKLRSVFSRLEAKDAEVQYTKSANL